MDKVSPQQRSINMSKVKSKNTKPEKIVRSLLHSLGYRFRLHRKTLPGTPDIVLPKYKAVIFVNGCFWHGHDGCKRATIPDTNKEFWERKISANKARDQKNIFDLEKLGYRCLVIWQCELKDKNLLIQRLLNFLTPKTI